MDVVSSFPLLNLPNDAIMHVLRNMEILPQIAFSFISEKTKSLAKYLNLKAKSMCITFNAGVTITVDTDDLQQVFWSFDAENMLAESNESNLKLPTPRSVEVSYHKMYQVDRYEWKNPGFEVKDWIDHLLTVLNHSKINEFNFFGRSAQFDIKAIHNLFKEHSSIWIASTCSNEYAQQILRTFHPVKNLSLGKNPFENPEEIHKIFNQNLDILWLDYCSIEFPELSLNELLIMNSSSIQIWNSILSNKVLNRFIKHWINGSNRRLEHMELYFKKDQNLITDKILKGVDFEIIPKEQKRKLPLSVFNRKDDKTIEGGFDILRKDKTKATIIIVDNWKLQMFVWH